MIRTDMYVGLSPNEGRNRNKNSLFQDLVRQSRKIFLNSEIDKWKAAITSIEQPVQSCCLCDNRGKCKSCVCKRRPCTNCKNTNCQYKFNQTRPVSKHRHHPYALTSSRNMSQNEGVIRNQQLCLAAGPKNNDQELSVSLMNVVDSLSFDKLRLQMKCNIADEPDFLRLFFNSGRLRIVEGMKTLIQMCSGVYLGQFPCITSKPKFRNLCLRHDVLEVANILSWSFRTYQDPTFQLSTFRNQAYRNFVIWQHGRLGAGR
uniref:Uncharacterized protein n=1 Tax=Magallana gigas TaxID=29159 RepID=A0A8W8NUN5_MAGGI